MSSSDPAPPPAPQAPSAAEAREIENTLLCLRKSEGLRPGMVNAVGDYAGFSIAVHVNEGKTQLALAPDSRGRTLAAVFTSDEAFNAWYPKGREHYATGQLSQIRLQGRALFTTLLKMDLQGMVFNCEGPGSPIAFALQFGEVVLKGDSATIRTSVTFDGETFFFTGDTADEDRSLACWRPDGQTVDGWSKMVNVMVFLKLTDPIAYAETLEQSIRQASPAADVRAQVNETTGEATVDYFKPPANAGEAALVTVLRLIKHARGVLAYQYSHRAGVLQGPSAAAESRALRDHWVQLLRTASFPEPPGLMK